MARTYDSPRNYNKRYVNNVFSILLVDQSVKTVTPAPVAGQRLVVNGRRLSPSRGVYSRGERDGGRKVGRPMLVTLLPLTPPDHYH